MPRAQGPPHTGNCLAWDGSLTIRNTSKRGTEAAEIKGSDAKLFWFPQNAPNFLVPISKRPMSFRRSEATEESKSLAHKSLCISTAVTP